MLRSVLSVIAGYAVMAIIVVAGFSVAFIAPDFAYQAGTLDVSTGWLVYTIVLSFLAAVAGGLVCVSIARSYQPVVVFAVLVLAYGMYEGFRNSQRERPNKTAAEIAAMSMMDKGQISVQPTAYAWSLPFIATAGVLIGGRIRK
jgi:hypothetical protein